jgi:hypothetical protein
VKLVYPFFSFFLGRLSSSERGFRSRKGALVVAVHGAFSDLNVGILIRLTTTIKAMILVIHAKPAFKIVVSSIRMPTLP